MPDYNFKKLSDAPSVSELPADGTVLGLSNDNVVQIPTNLIGGSSGGGGVFVINTVKAGVNANNPEYGDSVAEAFKSGASILIYNDSARCYTFPISVNPVSYLDSEEQWVPGIDIWPLIYEDYQGSGTYVATVTDQTAFSNNKGRIRLRLSKALSFE